MHGVYMNQPGQAAGGPYQAMPVSATGEFHGVEWSRCLHNLLNTDVPSILRKKKNTNTNADRACFHTDPNMVNAYMYQTAGTGGQPAAPGQAPPPNTSPPYSNYQPTPTQGYQVRAVGDAYGLLKPWGTD